MIPLGPNPQHFAIIDAEDLEKVAAHKWYVQPQPHGKSFYAVANGNSKVLIRMHRLILDAPRGIEVDHRDRNGLNNTKLNLRLANRSQQMWNTGEFKNNTSGYKGVTYLKDRDKYRSRIKVRSKSIHLGTFDTAEEAHAAYIKAKDVYHVHE
jgi:hypothetical protein